MVSETGERASFERAEKVCFVYIFLYFSLKLFVLLHRDRRR